MKTAIFEMKDLEPLVAELETVNKYSATMDMLFDGKFYDGGEPINSEGLTEAEYAKTKPDGCWWPDKEKINPSLIEGVLQLVGDQGVYLMTNANLDDGSTPSSRGTIIYAQGCNPDSDDDWYENKRYIFGGDDGGIDIPLDWYKIAKDKGLSSFKINLSGDSISLVLK